MPFLVPQSYFGLGVETTRGTAASVSAFIPCDSPTWTPTVSFGEDKGLRGSPVDVYEEQVLTRYDEIDVTGMVYADTFPNFLRAALGSVDTVASVAASVWSHTIGLLNAASVASQPPSYTLVYYTAGEADSTASVQVARQFTGAQLVSLDIEWSADAPLTYTAKFSANPAGSVAAPTQSYSNEYFIPAWSMSASVNSVASSVLLSGGITIDRSTEPIWTSGQQGPYRIFAGAAGVTGKVAFVNEIGDQTIVDGTTRVTLPLDFHFIEEVSGHYIDFHMSQAQLKDPKLDASKNYMSVSADFEAEGNTTDAVDGGYAQLKTVSTNALSTAF